MVTVDKQLKLPELRKQFWLNNPNWERERIAAMLKSVKKGDTVIDIGAELGDITALLAKKIGNTGEMYVFEPVDKMWPSIRTIFEMNGIKEPHCFIGFAGNETKNDGVLVDGFPTTAYGDIVDEPGFQHLNERWDLPVVKLDDLNLTPDIITMDVEGAEFEVIKGATETIKRCKPIIYISIHPAFMDDRYRQQAQDLISYVKELGYSSNLLAIDHETHVEFKPL